MQIELASTVNSVTPKNVNMGQGAKIDYRKELKNLYQAKANRVQIVNVPAMWFLMIDGKGKPGSTEFQDAIEALYSVSYAAKFMIKKGVMQIDYAVMPLEGLWWAEDMQSFVADRKDEWLWTLMIMQPPFVDSAMIAEAIDQVAAKKRLVSLSGLRYELLCEGEVAQTLHVGPFSNEGATVERLHNEIDGSGRRLCGKHHEIYLSDFRRAKPEKWSTIIRQPMVGKAI
jgi:hypothetical protein